MKKIQEQWALNKSYRKIVFLLFIKMSNFAMDNCTHLFKNTLTSINIINIFTKNTFTSINTFTRIKLNLIHHWMASRTSSLKYVEFLQENLHMEQNLN